MGRWRWGENRLLARLVGQVRTEFSSRLRLRSGSERRFGLELETELIPVCPERKDSRYEMLD